MSPPDVVLGQGALGTLLAVSLAQGSREVHLVSRRAEQAGPAEIEARGRGWTRRAEVLRTAEVPDEARFAVLACRADEARERARQTAGLLAEDGLLLSLQNGLVPIQVADAIDSERVAAGIVGFNARLVDPSTVEVTSPGHLTVGAFSPGKQSRADRLREALADPLRAEATDDARGAVWSKFCVSCAINGLAVVTGEGVGTVTLKKQGRAAVVEILSEVTRLAEAEGVELQRVAGPMRPDTLAGNGTSGLGGAFRRAVVWTIGRRYRDVVPSSIRALREDRNPELDALNGEAVERGEELRVATPWNRATLSLAEEVVAGEREPAMANLDELARRAQADG